MPEEKAMPFNWVVWVLIYMGAVSLVGFVMMGVDKKRAEEHRWRIPEKTLFTAAAIGGSIGILLGMMFFRHKTKHLSFTIGIPFILAAHCILILVLLFFLRGA